MNILGKDITIGMLVRAIITLLKYRAILGVFACIFIILTTSTNITHIEDFKFRIGFFDENGPNIPLTINMFMVTQLFEFLCWDGMLKTYKLKQEIKALKETQGVKP